MKRIATCSLITSTLAATCALIAIGLTKWAAAEEPPVSRPPSQKPGDLNEAKLQSSVSATAKELVQRCEFQMGETQTKLVLHPEPILHWTNPTVGTVFGDVFVWTDKGRPVVIACWYRFFSPDWGATLEVSSLTEKPMAGRVGDVRFWNSDKPGLKLSPLEDTDTPAPTSAARLGQMRRLAGDFVTHLADTRGDAAGVKRELRLLKQPIFRYPAADAKATYLDGALFAFVEGTDPEVFLLLEAVKGKDGANWHFGLARMNGDELRVDFRDTKVWSVATIKDWSDMSKEPYALFKSEQVFLDPAKEDGR